MKNDFKFFIPADIEKATDASGKEIMKFKGIASTGDRDSQGEFLDPSGFDLKHFSWVNWNHKGSSDPATIIGEPTKAVVTDKNELYIEGILYPDVPMAKHTWSLMKALQNSPSGNKLSLSVEGKVLQRGCGPEFLDKAQTIRNADYSPEKWNRIVKSKITGVAICPVPVNANTWVDFLQKGYTDNLNDDELDEETQKAITAIEGEGVTQKEDVEGPKNGLKKSEVFEKIYDRFPTIDIEKAKSVYSLIQKIATMNTDKQNEISEETITKAFEILELAASHTAIAKSADAGNGKEEEEEEDEDEKEMVKKAKNTCTVMKSEGKTEDEIKGVLIKKGYGEVVISKAMASTTEERQEVAAGLSKGEVDEIVKSYVSTFEQKFDAVNTILKSYVTTNRSLQEKVSDLETQNAELQKQLSEPQERKSLIVKSYSERFEKGEGENSNGVKKFNMKSKQDRDALKVLVTELSGINKGENFDAGLVSIAQEIELTGQLSKASDITKLQAHNIQLVVE